MLWAIDLPAFEVFLKGLALKIQAAKKLPLDELTYSDTGPIFAGPVEEAQRLGLPVRRDGSTAIIGISGPMLKNAGFLRFFGFASTRDIRGAVRSAMADDEISNILLMIDSPGGTVDGTAELADDVSLAAKTKTVVAQSDGMIASAAYWVASQANTISAGRMDLVGSIGVRMLTYDLSKMFEEAGIRAVAIDTGPFKSTGALGTELTEEQEAYLQGIVDEQFSEFRSAVMAGRNMNREDFEAVGDGRVFTMTNAISLGLVDRIQSIDETMNDFRKQAARKRQAQARLLLQTA